MVQGWPTLKAAAPTVACGAWRYGHFGRDERADEERERGNRRAAGLFARHALVSCVASWVRVWDRAAGRPWGEGGLGDGPFNATEDPILRAAENRDTIAMGSADGPLALAAFDGDVGGHGTTAAWETAVADHLHTMEDAIVGATEGPNRDTIVMESVGGPPALAGFDDDLSENRLAGMADDCCDFDLAELEPRKQFCSRLPRARTQGHSRKRPAKRKDLRG